ncbi:MAG: cob(I)yrinic acid a,c-diamide adenosyltransferase [Candidatus Omnitrophica bacterium]|nr:cob(I)yrinic acid a,c-diamide adenosyltransferase [Candidatus Omnitrophota bacterium]
MTQKAPRENPISGKAGQKGLLIVYTGEGKGKSTAAFGLAFRALGRDLRVGCVQFIKGQWKTGEEQMAARLPERVDWVCMGDGFTWETQNEEQDRATARKAWAKCLEMLKEPAYQVLIFDELNCVLDFEFLPVQEVIEALQERPAQTHVVVTGRGAPQALIEAADVVTEMKEIKHPYKQGFLAQPGVDY